MQKRGAYNFKNFLMTILIIMVFVFGSIAVFAAHARTIDIAPNMTKASAVTIFWINVTNDAGSNAIKEIRIDTPTTNSWGAPECSNIITGWTNISTATRCTHSTTGAGITAGSTLGFKINVTTGTATATESWIITTLEGGSSNPNVSGTDSPSITTAVDASAPTINLLNVTDGLNLTLVNGTTTQFDGSKFFNGSNIKFFVDVNDTGNSNVSYVELYYALNSSDVPDRNENYDKNAPLRLYIFEGSNVTDGVYNATLDTSGYADATNFTFSIFANDTLGNYVVENRSNNGHTFTIDKSAPGVTAMEITESFGVADDDFIDSSTAYIINASVSDRIANATKAHVRCDEGSWYLLIQNANDNTNEWNETFSMSTLGCTADGVHGLEFRAYDNATNKNQSEFINITIDDDVPIVFNINSNTSYNFTKNNLTQINITVNVSDYINPAYNMTLRNGSKADVNASVNLTLATGTLNGSSNWVITQNLTKFGCPGSTSSSGTIACTLSFNVSDLGGRENASESITIYIDGTGPVISTGSNKSTTNMSDDRAHAYNSTEQFNVSITTTDNIIAAYVNTTSGSSNRISLFNASGGDIWYNASTNATDLGIGTDAGAVTINFTVEDKAGYTNNTESLDITIDTSAPNIENFTTSIDVNGNRTKSTTTIRINASAWDSKTNVTGVTVTVDSTTTTLVNATTNGVNAEWNESKTPANLGCTANAESNCTVTYTARDLVRNKKTQNMTLVIDDRAPRITSSSINTSSVSSTTQKFNITLTVEDPNLNLQSFSNVSAYKDALRVNLTKGTSYSDGITSNWSVETDAAAFGCTSDGDCQITFNATDDVGNINTSESITIQVDATGPTISGINVNPNPTRADANITVSAILRDGQGVNGSRAYLDGYTTQLYYLTTGTFGGTEVNVSGKVDLTTACGGSICGDGTHVVYVQSNNSADTWSTSSNYTFTIDSTAPGAVSSFTAANVSGSTIRLSWNAASDGDTGSGVASYNIYRASSSSFTPNNATGGNQIVSGLTGLNYETTQQDGTFYYLVTAVDAVDNEGTKSSELSVAMDATAPTHLSVLIANNSQYTNLTNPLLTLAATGADLMSFSCDGSTWSEGYSYAASSTGVALTNTTIGCTSADGTKTVYFRVNDTWGNMASAESDSITLDTTAPAAMSGVLPSSAVTDTDGAYTWEWNAANDGGSGIDYYAVEIDEDSAGTYLYKLENVSSAYYTLTGLTDRNNYTLRVRAFDKAGNSNAWSTASVVTIDKTAPGVTALVTPEKNTWTNDTTPLYNITVDTNVTSCEFTKYVDGAINLTLITDSSPTTSGTSKHCKFTFTTVASSSLAYATTRVRDAAGTWSSPITLPTYTVDTSKPMINLSSPLPNNVTTTRTPTITFNITDEVGGTLINSSTLEVADDTDGTIGFSLSSHCTTPDNARTYACSFTSSALTDDAKHTLSVSGRDKANNVVNLTRTFIVNTTIAINATLVASDTTGTADGTYANGWSFTFNISTGTGVNTTRVKMNDWTLSGTTTTMKVDGNTKMTYTDNTSTSRTYQVHNTYNDTAGVEEIVYALRDDSAKSGKQSQVVVAVKIPTGTTTGSYTTSYTFGAYTINASGVA